MQIAMIIPKFAASRREKRLMREGRVPEALDSISKYVTDVIKRNSTPVGHIASIKFILSRSDNIYVVITFDQMRIPTNILGRMMKDRNYYFKLRDTFSSSSGDMTHKMYMADEDEKSRAKSVWELVPASSRPPSLEEIPSLPMDPNFKLLQYSVCIPLVYPTYDERALAPSLTQRNIAERVKAVLTHHDFGIISRIDVKSEIRGQPIKDGKGVTGYRVFVHFSDMNSKHLSALECDGGSVRIFYDKKWYWDVRKNRKPPGPTAYQHPQNLSGSSFPGHPNPNPNPSSVEYVRHQPKVAVKPAPPSLVVTLGGDSDSEDEDDVDGPHTPIGPPPMTPN